jgi:hypothetical protein
VISRTTLAVSCRRANSRRALSYLLFLLIAHGATAEAAHSHGLVSPERPGVAAIVDAGGSQSSDKGDSHYSDCSVCQFQLQLFDGLVQAPLIARTPLAEIAFVSTLPVFNPSTSTTPPSGRAPPLGRA